MKKLSFGIVTAVIAFSMMLSTTVFAAGATNTTPAPVKPKTTAVVKKNVTKAVKKTISKKKAIKTKKTIKTSTKIVKPTTGGAVKK